MTSEAKNPTFELDLCSSFLPVQFSGTGEPFPELALAESEIDPSRGARFPLQHGGLAFASRDELDDASGSLAIEFSLSDGAGDGGLLFQAWADYLKVTVSKNAVKVAWYFDALEGLTGPLGGVQTCILTLAWDYRVGIMFRLAADGRAVCERSMRRTWRPYRTKWCPFSIGGYLHGRRLVRWDSSFAGWVRSVKLWDYPILPLARSPAIAKSQEPTPLDAVPGLRLLALDDPPIYESGLAHATIPDRLDDLARTREEGALDEAVRTCRTEFEQFVALTEFVTNLYPHSWYWPSPEDSAHLIIWKPGYEIIRATRNGEMGGMCGSYAHVMEEVFWAMGFEGRRIQVDGHSTFEAWSNQHNKWVELESDSTCAGHAEYLDGTPLNAWDAIRVHREAETDTGAYGRIRNVPHRSQGTHNDAVHGRKLYLAPRTLVVIPIGDYQNGFQRAGAYGWHVPDQCFGEESFMYKPNGWVDDPQDLYWSCNRARVSLAWQEAGERVRVSAEAVRVSHFEALEASIDEAPHSDMGGDFGWRLHPGVNSLSVRVRNRFGVTGYPYRIQIWKA